MTTRHAIGVVAILILPALLNACQLLGLGTRASPDVRPDLPSVTCAGWGEMTEEERITLADVLVGDSTDLFERIRARQHEPVGTPRNALIADVSGSITKGCMVWAAPHRPVAEIVTELYGS